MRAEAGFAAVELALAVALLLIPGALIVLGFSPWSERAVFAEAAAAEAARAAVIQLAVDEGNQVVDEMAANYGLDGDEVRLGWCGATPRKTFAGECAFVRGGAVWVQVEVWVPLVNTPWGSIGGIWINRSHAEAVDLYRSLG